ncbi:MAG: VWA domain-containing protein [Chloroflexi bacterium]|nr:VWA domain-containing protein [Chloroflexota bacterium]
MRFADPLALGLAALALPLLLISLRARPTRVAVPSTAAFGRLRPTLRLRAARALPVLRALAIVLLAVALARPRIGDANAVVPAQGIDISLSLDTSGSMTTSQLGAKSRLEASKDVIREFIKGRKDDRIGLVIFQTEALALSPPTLDHDALDTIVAKADSGLLPEGTGIGVGLAMSVNMLRESTAASRVVILLTDGQQNASSISPEDAADLAEALKIKVYTIGVLDPRDANRGEVDEKLLKSIADRTGAKYFTANSPSELAAVYDEIGKLETSSVGRERFEQFTELAPWFAGGAALLVGIELLLAGTWLRRVPA